MSIIQATEKDLVEVLFLMKECVYDLNSKGLKHWNNAYPSREYLIQCIDDNVLYIAKEKGVAKGLMIFDDKEPDEYENINWKGSSDKILYLRYLAVHPLWLKGGVDKEMIAFAEKHAKENSIDSIRIDVFSGIEGAQSLYSGLGFNESGQFHSKFQQTPYSCFEKSL